MTVGQRVMLTGDNFEIPRVGLRGTVIEIGPEWEVIVHWDDDTESVFTQYQAARWTCPVTEEKR